MKVTVLLSDDLVKEVEQLSHGKDITECITIALREWVAREEASAMTGDVIHNPLSFIDGFSAEKVRQLNRGKRQ